MPEQLITRDFDLSVTKRTDDDSKGDNMVLSFPFSSEEPYLRSNWFDDPWVEILGHRSDEVDLSRLNSGAPVFLNHGNTSTEKAAMRSIGVTQRAWIEGERGHVEIKLSRRDDMLPVLQDLEDGIIRNVSVGYKIHERTLLAERDNEPNEYRVTSWLPMEVTLCDIPADATVGIGRSINQEDAGMPVKQADNEQVPDKSTRERTEQVVTQNVAEKSDDTGTEKTVKDAVVAERSRVSEITQACRSVNILQSDIDGMIQRGISIDEARQEILEKLAQKSEKQEISSRADIVTVRDETETMREMVASAIMHRADPGNELPDSAREYAYLSMTEIVRGILNKRGVKTAGLSKMQIAERAFHSTSDFPHIFADVANKSLRKAYEAAPKTFPVWARRASASDFKNINRMTLSDAPKLEEVNENGEFKRGTFSDGKETYQLTTVGKIVGFSRQSLINDDLDALTRFPALFATSAANYESDTVYAVLIQNAPLQDGTALFHADHNNLTGTGTAISVNSLGKGSELMGVQETPNGAPMNITPRFLLVPRALLTVAAQYTSQQYVAAKSSDFNPHAGALEVVAEARLDKNSKTAWYLLADNAAIDTVEYAYLEGNDGVFIETRHGFDVDGMEIKARLDFAAKAIDYRGVFKNNGA